MAVPTALSSDDLWRYAPNTDVYLGRAGAPSWLDELDIHSGPPFVKMGTHTSSIDEWFVIDDAFEQELALRQRLLAEQRDVVFDCRPTAEAAAEETLELVSAWLRERGLPCEPADAHPLAAAGTMVPDDLCLMVPRDGDWWFDGGLVCFPSIWRLVDKIGRSTTSVHETVAHYRDDLAGKVDRYFHGMPVDRLVWRRNLSIKPWPLLHVPTTKPQQPLGPLQPADDGSPFWLRSERQTLRRLPRTGAILFAIKVQIAPASVLLHRPDVAAGLAAMYRSFDSTMDGYKIAANDLLVGFVPWLEQVAAGATGG
ncbi:MAG: DUF3445 domain-containing protein [Actinomycetota bacterium]|nr:DUF3445 domain-containing protein [Actinomycetota bacterium]